jgi:hypothetical protein
MRLTDDELRDVLERAEEIQRTSRRGELMNGELEAVIGAAEEVGLTRAAVGRALRERLNLVSPPSIVSGLFFTAEDAPAHLHESIRRTTSRSTFAPLVMSSGRENSRGE